MAESRVLVLNAGSSSLKFKIFDFLRPALTPAIWGLVERIGEAASGRIVIKTPTGKGDKFELPIPDHVKGLDHVIQHLKDKFSAAIADEVRAVGHRVVHGGTISTAALIDSQLRNEIEKACDLAPLHNPANLSGIDAASIVFKGKPQVGVFDTAFHQTMPPKSYMYAIPRSLYEERAIRRYGFHGTSYLFLTHEAARLLNKPVEQTNLIICHLGNGASMCAVENGQSIDTTMGMTPLEGLVMGTRSGDVDPAVVFYLAGRMGMAVRDVDNMLNKKSGLQGLCGYNDMRQLLENAGKGDENARIGMQVFVHRVRKYLGAFMVHLRGRVDAVVFSGGIGENASLVRQHVAEGLEAMGIAVDTSKNAALVGGAAGEFQSSDSKIRLMVLPTDEELCIAQQTVDIAAL